MEFLSSFTILVAAFTMIAGQEQNYEYYTGRFRLETTVFNGFPLPEASAFIVFEEDRVSRLKYGDVAVVHALLEPHSDYIIQFRKAVTEEILQDYTDYGFMSAELDEDKRVVIILGRDREEPSKLDHRLLVFEGGESQADPDSSKLFIYNSLWNSQHGMEGLNFYALYLRTNYDGSESESITQLAINLAMNDGWELTLEPGIELNIKGFYTVVKSVADFKNTIPVISLNYRTLPGKQQCLVAYGDYGSDSAPPRAMLLQVSSAIGQFRIQALASLSLLFVINSLAIQ